MASSWLRSQLNLKATCKSYGLPLWQCPNFLFLIMGLVIIASIIFSYMIGTQIIEDPTVVALLTIILAGILLVIAYIITNSVERLAEASRLKAEFVSIVSHQLRSPISNLQWGLEVLLSDKVPLTEEKQKEYLHILKENSGRMQDLVNDLLVVSRIQEGSVKLAKKPFLFKETLTNLLEEFEPWIRASNIAIEIEGDDQLPQIFSDPLLLAQVAQNFVENAIRYGGSTIKVRYAKKGHNLYFEVADNGVGIPKGDQKNIFQKFFRANNVLRHETQGTGLGLYIAKSMIEILGGKIGFRSQENKGSTFWFTIPIK